MQRLMKTTLLFSLVATLLAVGPTSARGAGETDIASAFDKDDPFDFNFRVEYRHRIKRGAINRELLGRTPSQAGVEMVKELRFSEVTDIVALRAEAGLWRDLQLHVELPIILRSSRELSFARNGGDSCGAPSWTNCVTPVNSTLTRDGLIDADQMPLEQRIVAGPDGAPGGRLLPDRAGIDQIHLGLSWAPVNQRRDRTKPTWVIGFETRVAVGTVMDYDPARPNANTGVSHGVHHYHWWTAISRRFPYVDTWTSLHYMLPVARSDSLFEKTRFPGSGQQRSDPQHFAWLDIGVAFIPWEQPKMHNRFSIELLGRLEGVFEGRGYSPLWEMLAGQPKLAGPCLADAGGGMLAWDNGSYCRSAAETIPYPGVTRIDNHLRAHGLLALTFELTKFFKGRLGVSLGHEQEHFITSAQAGRGICNPNEPETCRGKLKLDDPRQVNPLYRPIIDAPGRRFKVSETTVFDFFIAATGRF